MQEPAAAERPAPVEKPAGRAGGVYIPPFKLAQMLREAQDESSGQFQRLRWDALRKSLNGLINKVNKENIKAVLPEIFGEVCCCSTTACAASCSILQPVSQHNGIHDEHTITMIANQQMKQDASTAASLHNRRRP